MPSIPALYPKAVYVGSPKYSERGGYAPEAIVIHIAEGTVAGMDSWFNSPQNTDASAHYGVNDITVHQYVDNNYGAWANGVIEPGHTAALITENSGANPNRWTIAIEHEGKFPQQPSAATFENSAQLAAWLFKNVLLVGGATGVAVDRKHILRHADISPKSRPNCPGWSEAVFSAYIARVKQIVEGGQIDPRIVQARDLLNQVLGN